MARQPYRARDIMIRRLADDMCRRGLGARSDAEAAILVESLLDALEVGGYWIAPAKFYGNLDRLLDVIAAARWDGLRYAANEYVLSEPPDRID